MGDCIGMKANAIIFDNHLNFVISILQAHGHLAGICMTTTLVSSSRKLRNKIALTSSSKAGFSILLQ